MLQASVTLASPVHDPPLLSAAVFNLVISRSPVPQVVEHSPMAHELQRQLTFWKNRSANLFTNNFAYTHFINCFQTELISGIK